MKVASKYKCTKVSIRMFTFSGYICPLISSPQCNPLKKRVALGQRVKCIFPFCLGHILVVTDYSIRHWICHTQKI